MCHIKSFKLMVWLLVSLWLSLSLMACSDTTTTTSVALPATVAPTGVTTPVTVRWSYWGSDAEVEINKKIATQFEKLNPGIKIEHIFVPFEQYFDKVQKEWNGPKAPDVMYLNTIPNYASLGLLENIEPYIQRDKALVNLDDIYPRLLNTFRYNGSLYGLPRDNDTKVIYYNKRLFDEAGVPYPQQGWSWNDLRNAALKLTKKDAAGQIVQYGYGFELKTWWRLWVYQNGGKLYDDFSPPNPPAKLLLNTPEAATAIQFWADLINVDHVAPPPDQMQTSNQLNDLFTQGKIAMVFGGHGKVKVFDEAQHLNWDVVGLPGDKLRVNNVGGAGYTISKFSPNKEAAWTFIRYLQGVEGQALYVGSGLIVAARRSVREATLFNHRQNYNTQVFMDESEQGMPNPQFVRSPEIDKLLDDALVPVFEGKRKAAEVLAELPAKVDPLLADAAKGANK
jgi:multiple sugar transport system substrate-binding protein